MSSFSDTEDAFFDLDMSLGSPVKDEVQVMPKKWSTNDDEEENKIVGIVEQAPSPAVWTRANQEDVMNEATKWRTDLEMMRDEMHILSVKNAILLDSMAMAGCDCAGN
jgi:hypothetical protein